MSNKTPAKSPAAAPPTAVPPPGDRPAGTSNPTAQLPPGAQQFWVMPQQMQQMPVPQDPGRVFVNPSDPGTLHYEGFDAGARFSNLAPPRIPPPPPGVPPNPAQVAHMQGQNVVVTQRKSNWIAGGSNAGVDTQCVLQ
ncbi:uncharacterized protein LOC144148964 [Haemaphysalis longicornis]|uniref:DAZ-associated protein 2 n=1 Tax=Haemaphysalis longicornis TaxID=44386 RepID=A0A9J6GLT3_HAELO|nr:hypothetical protein HPB48_012561 [Haemaphysalis longicornis]